MNRKTIITALLVLVAMAGQGQVKCHVEGTLETDAWGDEVIICEAGTDLRVVDEPRFHVKAKDGHFTYDIETITPDGRRVRDDLRIDGYDNFDYELQRLKEKLK